MNAKLSNFLIKISPTSTLRRRMRFFANRAMSKALDMSDGSESDMNQMIIICRFWAKEVLKRKPNDGEAKKYENFPDSMPKR